MTASVESVSQQSHPGAHVILFDVDLTAFDGTTRYFTPSMYSGAVVEWRGNTYTPLPVEADGFEWNGQGALPQPRLRFSNVNKVIGQLVVTYRDLVGAKVTRWKTFGRFLDGQPDADPDAHYNPDVYNIERKVKQTKLEIEFTLSAAMDQQGVMIPRRQVIQQYCRHRYRRWNPLTGAFDYSKATCPYTDAPMFTRKGDPTGDPTQDICGKRLTDCQNRFGAQNELFTWAFPGVAKVR